MKRWLHWRTRKLVLKRVQKYVINVNGGVDAVHNAVDKSAFELDTVTIEEDDIHEIGEEEKEKFNDVDYLTGNLLSSDILLYAVPVCGPYNAVQSYKYRVKIIPGSVKRGKGAKTAMNSCLATCRMQQLERS